MKRCIVFVFISSLFTTAFSQQIFPYKNSRLSIDARVRDLLARMTPEEKFWQLFMIPGDLHGAIPDQYKNGLFGFQVSAVTKADEVSQQMMNYNVTENAATLAAKVNAIQKHFVENTRLGIPLIIFDEALHGLVRKGATSFPQSIALAASWDTSLMHRVGHAIAYQSRQRGIRQILSPVINIASDVRWGRTEETYGEDPYLTSLMAVAYVSELEKAGVIATPKHFLANVGDGGRDSYPIHFNERLLREIHLPPFLACFEKAGARSVMTSYNSLDGSPATANNWLLNQLLKKEWRFKGFVISDASAVGGANVLHFTATGYPDASKKAIQNGLDVIFQTSYDHYKLFIPPFLDGSITSERIDDAVTRVLKAKFELGLFENPYVDTALFRDAPPVNAKSLAMEAAQKGMVLLKNEGKLLPLSRNIRSIAVIGEEAKLGRLGGYSGPGNGVTNLWEGIKRRAGSGLNVRFAAGAGIRSEQWLTVPGRYLYTDASTKTNGVITSHYRNIDLTGAPSFARTDEEINFNWTLYGPSGDLAPTQYSLKWNTKLKAPETGRFAIGLEGNDGYRLYIDNKLVIDNWQKRSFQLISVPFSFEKDRLYDIRVEFYETTGNAHIRLVWNIGVDRNEEMRLQEAVSLARQCDITIVAVGIHEGEFQDRAFLSLPGRQEELIRRLAATGKPVVVILFGGSAITMPWLNKISSVLNVWYPGEEGGAAIASVLFGDYNPAGRLPITYPIHESQLPLVYNHKPTGRGDDYHNLTGSPLFPFGFGLSYTSFRYSNLVLQKQTIAAGDTAKISVDVTNTGQTDGEEVVQLYLRDELASVARPVSELKGFQRVFIRKGETVRLEFNLAPEAFEMYDVSMKRVIEPGDFSIMLGSSSKEIKLKSTLTIR